MVPRSVLCPVATFNYRARATFGLSTLNYSKWSCKCMVNGIFFTTLAQHQGEKDVMYCNATDWNLNIMKNNKLKNCFVRIFYFIFGQLACCSERVKETNLKKSDWDNHMVWIQSYNGYLFHKVYFTIRKWLTTSVLCFETMLVWSWTDKSSLGYAFLFTHVQLNWCIMVRLNQCSSLYFGNA